MTLADLAGAEAVLQHQGRAARWGRRIVRLGRGRRQRRALRHLSLVAAGRRDPLSSEDVRNLILVAAEQKSPELLVALREACTERLVTGGSDDILSLCKLILDITSDDAQRFISAAWVAWWRPPTFNEMALICGWSPGPNSIVWEKTKPSAFMATVFPSPS